MRHIQRIHLWDLVPTDFQYLPHICEYLETNREEAEIIKEVLSVIGLDELILLSGKHGRQS